MSTTTVDLSGLKNAVGFVPQFRCRFGNLRKANIDKITLDRVLTNSPEYRAATTDAEREAAERKAKKQLQLKKQLIVSPEYDAIKSYFGEVQAWVYGQTVPSFFKKGFQLASLAAVDAIERKMKQASGAIPVGPKEDNLPKLIERFIAAYPEQVKTARGVLEPIGQWNEADYPDVKNLPFLFEITWNWIAFTVPDGLPEELKRAEQDKLEKQFADAGEQITLALRVAFKELIEHATERLTVSPGEKPKTFRDSLIGNVQEFIDTFSQRNIMNDADLAKLVSQAQYVLLGVTPEKLRTTENTREGVRAQFAAIQTTLDTMITQVKSRRIDLSEDTDNAQAA